MNEVTLKLNEKGMGAFLIADAGEQLGEMEVGIYGKNLVVFHTEVAAKAEGKGLAKELLNTMVDYARSNALQVVPHCAYVQAQFKRHPQDYADVWSPNVDAPGQEE